MGNTQSKKANNIFLKKANKKRNFSYKSPYKIKIKSGAIQGEFGEKKFIKP